jgi:hypothetical protein
MSGGIRRRELDLQGISLGVKSQLFFPQTTGTYSRRPGECLGKRDPGAELRQSS